MRYEEAFYRDRILVSYFAIIIVSIFSVSPLNAQADDEKDVYKTQVPAGMELIQPGNKPGYRVVLPKGTAMRREGDVRIIEGSGEYAARKFVVYDDILAKMNSDIASLKKDVDDLKNAISKTRENKLVSDQR